MLSGIEFYGIERSSGKLSRRFRLPEKVRSIRCMEIGVLTVTILKEEK